MPKYFLKSLIKMPQLLSTNVPCCENVLSVSLLPPIALESISIVHVHLNMSSVWWRELKIGGDCGY